ncbi:metal-binding protein [Gordonia spumicola]|uniref:Metal-binding protein n=1 Tax=Gordonia spumicola TaxID=589161 RepID=A0A7I9V4Y7_9ACTN|nr:metal-binding protein [Gordonia spumicola]GEE00485.1 metal-binding protein [Gordonia spumicola]
MSADKFYILTAADGSTYQSATKGTWGGHRRGKIYGRMDCPTALRAIARGGYVTHRVFFIDEQTAVDAGYRPCGACCVVKYRRWKAADERGEPWRP